MTLSWNQQHGNKEARPYPSNIPHYVLNGTVQNNTATHAIIHIVQCRSPALLQALYQQKKDYISTLSLIIVGLCGLFFRPQKDSDFLSCIASPVMPRALDAPSKRCLRHELFRRCRSKFCLYYVFKRWPREESLRCIVGGMSYPSRIYSQNVLECLKCPQDLVHPLKKPDERLSIILEDLMRGRAVFFQYF